MLHISSPSSPLPNNQQIRFPYKILFKAIDHKPLLQFKIIKINSRLQEIKRGTIRPNIDSKRMVAARWALIFHRNDRIVLKRKL